MKRFKILFLVLIFAGKVQAEIIEQTWTFEGIEITGSNFINGIESQWAIDNSGSILTDNKVTFSTAYDSTDTSVSVYEDPVGQEASNLVSNLVVETFNQGDLDVDQAQDVQFNLNVGMFLLDLFNWYAPLGLKAVNTEFMLPYYNDTYFGGRIVSGTEISTEYFSLATSLLIVQSNNTAESLQAKFTLTEADINYDPNNYKEVYLNWASTGTYSLTEVILNDGEDRDLASDDRSNQNTGLVTVSEPRSITYIYLFAFLAFYLSRRQSVT